MGLSRAKLALLLPSKKLGKTLHVFEELDSTNTFAMEHAKTHGYPATVILADRQTAGRGRLNRTWHSPANSNIYGSIVVFCSQSFRFWGWIPLMAGVAIAKAVERHTGVFIDLKWPNDLLLGGRKVGGVLCESFPYEQNQKCVVIGFGINVNLPQAAFPQDLQKSATTLHTQTQGLIERELLIMHIIKFLEEEWEKLMTMPHINPVLHSEYRNRCSTIGKFIEVQFPDGKYLQGWAHSIGELGQLNLVSSASDINRPSATIREVHSGEIFHVRPAE